jgi:hypothetical protein
MTQAPLAVFFTIAGAAFLVGSAILCLRTRHLLQTCAASTGTVTQVFADEDVTPDHDECYFYVVEFEDGSGQVIHLTCPSGGAPPYYREGQQVPILYEPSRPAHAVVDSFMSLWYHVLALLGAGVVFVGGGLRLLLFG